ncbi:lanthionine synthetase LanC family protein [Dysgonomonas sp. ZJ709]|uniref:lanthionine synthetase LanC family protein n=1 Tax=Dysgonomonas sp. ZJ709 TaxID=2709797 RepID=UPI0013EB07B0|nr:lanthionine synthetase LanC family protein [Dysgonomonas sp. ZJ709]
MEKDLLRIANTFVLNIQNIRRIGLLDGKMGIAIFLFNYARISHKQIYNSYAEELLEQVFDSLQFQNISLDMVSGLSGIGWGINYLLKNEFVEGDPNEILNDLDERILRYLDKYDEISYGIDLQLSDLYICTRLDKMKIVKDCELAMNKLLILNDSILTNPKIKSLVLLNSIIYSLIQVDKFRNCKLDTLPLWNKLNEKLIECIGNKLFNDSDFKTLIRFSTIEKNKLKIPYIDENKITNSSTKYIWQDLLYGNTAKICIKQQCIKKTIDELIMDLSEDSLSLKNGLAGIGLGLIKEQYEFQI